MEAAASGTRRNQLLISVYPKKVRVYGKTCG
jgi:hypothetical protein